MTVMQLPHLMVSDLPVLDGLWTPIWLFDSERARMIWGNKAALELWQAGSLQNFQQRDFSDMSEATRTRLAALREQLAAGAQVIDQWTFYPAGQPVTMQVRRTGMMLPDGRLGMLHEARPFEQPVDPNTLRGVEALNHTTVLISMFSRSGRLLMRNPAAQRCFGLVDTAGDSDRLASHFVDEADRQNLQETLEHGRTFHRTVEVLTQQGLGWHLVDARITTDPVTGDPVVLVNEQDVAEQVRAEQAVRSSEHRLARMVEHLPAGAAYVEGGRLLLNRAAEEISGYTRKELPTLEVWFKVAYPTNHEEVRRRYDAARISGSPVSTELQITRKDGTLRWVQFSAYFSDVGEVWLIRDVTDLHMAIEALDQERAMLESLIESIPDLVFFKDRNGAYLRCNRAALDFAGLSAEAAIGMTDAQLFDAETAKRRHDRNHIAMEQGLARSEDWLTASDGRHILLETAEAACVDRDGQVLGAVGVSRDVTERRRAEEALRQQRALLQGIIETMPDAVFFKDRDGVFRKVNRAFAAWHGQTPDETIGLSYHDLWPGDLAATIQSNDEQAYAENRPHRSELTIPIPTGGTISVEIVKAPIRDANGDLMGLVGIGRDITERKRIEEVLRRSEAEKAHLANHDALTGMPNRRLFKDRLNLSLSCARRYHRNVALLFIDLDGFKPVNDHFGHDRGDQVLQVTAERIAGCLRKSDTVARVGGDEFTAILENVTSPTDTERVAREIIRAVSLPILLDGQEVVVGASIGIALYSEDAPDADALLIAADRAMYQAKHAGGGRYSVAPPAPTMIIEHF